MNRFRIFQYAMLALILGPLAAVSVYGTGKAIAQAVNSSAQVNIGATKVTVNSPPNDVISGPTNLTGTGNVSVNSQGSGSVGIIVTGTGTGLTFTFQGSVDGTNYVTVPCVVPSTGAIATGGSANGTWTCQAAGYQNVRVNLSAISGGTFTATLNASAGSNQPPIGTQGTATNLTAVAGTPTVSDPCHSVTATYTPISITSATTTRIVAPVSAKRTYVCYMFLLSAIANNIGIVEGTGGTCGSSTAGVVGGTTAANGINLAANSGAVFQAGGEGAIATAGTNVDLCLITSTAGPVAGHIKWVQAP